MGDKISIIIPFYNAESYLENCLESVRIQNYKKFECLLIDDGSTDNSLKIAKKYVDMDDRFCVISQKNAGVSEARNCGLIRAEGEYITFIDADDWIEPQYLEKLIYSLIKNNAEMSISAVWLHNGGEASATGYLSDGICCQQDALYSLFSDAEMKPVVWGKLFVRDIIIRNKILMNGLISYSEDILYICQYLLKISKVATVSQPLYHYRLDNISSAQNVGETMTLYNLKWDSAWIAYGIMEQELCCKLDVDDTVTRRFLCNKTEFARDMLYRQKKYGIVTDISDEMKDYVNRNWKNYCLSIGSIKKSLSMLSYIFMPKLYHVIHNNRRKK